MENFNFCAAPILTFVKTWNLTTKSLIILIELVKDFVLILCYEWFRITRKFLFKSSVAGFAAGVERPLKHLRNHGLTQFQLANCTDEAMKMNKFLELWKRFNTMNIRKMKDSSKKVQDIIVSIKRFRKNTLQLRPYRKIVMSTAMSFLEESFDAAYFLEGLFMVKKVRLVITVFHYQL